MALEWVKTILGDAYTDEIGKKIQDEIGKGFVAKKDFDDQREKLKNFEADVAARDKQIEELKAASGDAGDLAAKLKAAEEANQQAATDRKTLEDKHASELARRDFDDVLSKALTAAKAKDPADVKAHLNIEELQKSQNQSADIEAAIKGIQEKKDYLFESGEPHQNPVAPTKNEPPAGGAQTAVMRAAMGLPAEKKE